MLILFDHGTPRGLARALPGHTVTEAKARGWDRLNNGDLLKAAEEAAFDLLLTTDQRIRHQQNLTRRKIAIIVLNGTTKWSRVRLHLERIAAAVNSTKPAAMPRWTSLTSKAPAADRPTRSRLVRSPFASFQNAMGGRCYKLVFRIP